MEAPKVESIASRLPPQNIEAEQSVLGGIMIDNDAINRAIEFVEVEDFYRESHRKIFRAMLDLSEKGEPIDLLTLTNILKDWGELDDAGGGTYLSLLVDQIPTAANLATYAKIVREKSVLRRLIHGATEIVTRCYDATGETDHLLDQSEKIVFDIAQKRIRQPFFLMKDIVKAGFKIIEKLYERQEMVTGVPTGFIELDRMTAGLQPSDLIVVAGRPSMGKTAFALCVAAHAALQKKVPCAIFSLEMSKEQLAQRMLCLEGRIDSSKLRGGFLAESDWPKLTRAAGELSEAPIFVDDSPGINILEMRAKARRLKKEHGLGLVVVDYLQLMRGLTQTDNREREISEISRSLKALAKELNIPIMALSQLNRMVENRRPPKPILADIRECVVGDTLVLLTDGRRIPIRDLVGTQPNVWALSKEGQVVAAQSDKVWLVGKRSVFEIKLASGRHFVATARHRFYGASGWVRVENLKAGDRLALTRKIPPAQNSIHWPESWLILLGHLVGDGSYLTHQPLRYTTASEENSEAVAEAARSLGATVKRYPGRGNWHQLVLSGNGNRWHHQGVGRWLRDLGVFGQRSHEKRLPEDVFRLDDDQIGLLLRHLWATDGCIFLRNEDSKGSHRVYFSTCSEGLALDVAALLARLGIVARLHQVLKTGMRPVHTVDISGADQLRLFLKYVGAFGPRQQPASKLERWLETVTESTNTDTLPQEVFSIVRQEMRQQGISTRGMAALRGTSYGGSSHFAFAPSRHTLQEYAEILDNDSLRDLCRDTLFWDRVVAIEPAGEQDVFDLTVPGPSSWLADGLVSHNSGAIEQDADLILFLYREEIYDRETINKGMAEVIIGKQRNGPVGEVKLAFIAPYTRFENLSREG